MSDAEEELAMGIKALKLSKPEREYVFAAPRKWRFDFAWPDKKIAVEVEGGVFVHGSHTRGESFTKDCEKYNAATLKGWKVLRYTPQMISQGIAYLQLDSLLRK